MAHPIPMMIKRSFGDDNPSNAESLMRTLQQESFLTGPPHWLSASALVENPGS